MHRFRVRAGSFPQRSGHAVGGPVGNHEMVLPFGLGDPAPEPGVEQLEPDDVVLLYTDGVTEARTPDGNSSGWTGWPICWSGKPPAAGKPGNCCGAWSSRCSITRPATCAMTPRCYWCNGPVPDRLPADEPAWRPGCAAASSKRSMQGQKRARLPYVAVQADRAEDSQNGGCQWE